MGTRYICDLCGKECDVKGGVSSGGYTPSYDMPPGKWAVITYVVSNKKSEPGRVGPIFPYSMNVSANYLVCSQACAEKALTEIGARLQTVFDEVA